MAGILLIDDQKNFLQLCRMVLEDEGHHVHTVSESHQALHQARRVRPSLVAIEMYLRGMHGIDLLDRLRSWDPTTPIIIHTTFSRYQDNYMTWTADAFVTKSSDMGLFTATVNRLLRTPNNGTGWRGQGSDRTLQAKRQGVSYHIPKHMSSQVF